MSNNNDELLENVWRELISEFPFINNIRDDLDNSTSEINSLAKTVQIGKKNI